MPKIYQPICAFRRRCYLTSFKFKAMRMIQYVSINVDSLASAKRVCAKQSKASQVRPDWAYKCSRWKLDKGATTIHDLSAPAVESKTSAKTFFQRLFASLAKGLRCNAK
ncbi:MAG: hypothetical protein ABIE74_10755 [Pseudomonadota bacterium]